MKNFRVNLIIRAICLTLTILVFSYTFFQTDLIATLVIIALLIIYQIISIIRFTDRTNKELTRFLQSVKYSDFSQTFTHQKLGKSFRELNEAFSDVITEFQKTRTEKEENFRFLQTVIQHVGIGLISFNENGKIEFINNAAKILLKVPDPHNIEALNNVSPGLGDTFLKLQNGEKSTLRLEGKEELIQILVYATEFKMRNQNYTLLSLQNIQTELEEKEMEAWQKLIRVLTHEIMNSVAPISSLAGTINNMIETDLTDSETVNDMRIAADTIKKRSDGLIRFVDNYRSLTHVPKPSFQIFPIKEIFERIRSLMGSEISSRGIEFSVSVTPDNLKLAADPELIEQVLINLLLNSLYSLKGTKGGQIKLIAHLDEREKITIRVIDNGPGISEQMLEKIFIPFFSTKKDGSGIGLSLSRQIMRSHGGSIRVSSRPDIETVFTLKF